MCHSVQVAFDTEASQEGVTTLQLSQWLPTIVSKLAEAPNHGTRSCQTRHSEFASVCHQAALEVRAEIRTATGSRVLADLVFGRVSLAHSRFVLARGGLEGDRCFCCQPGDQGATTPVKPLKP